MNVVASTIKTGAYISLQSALAHHGVIPEHVAQTTAVTTGRPATIDSQFGTIRFPHIKAEVFFGFARHEVGMQHAYVATPEKALLDLLYLTPGGDPGYLSELRLQGVDGLDVRSIRAAEDQARGRARRSAGRTGRGASMKDHLHDLVARSRTTAEAGLLVREYLQARVLEALQRAGAFSSWTSAQSAHRGQIALPASRGVT